MKVKSQVDRLYIIIDETLDPIYGCVQGGHAVAEYLLKNPDSIWKNNYLIYLKGNLDDIVKMLQKYDIKYVEFFEPDLKNKRTAIAVLNNKNLFKNLKLIGR